MNIDWQPVLGIVADIIGVLGAIFALGAWTQTRLLQKQIRSEEERMNQKVKLVLKSEKKEAPLPFELRRAELTRAEVLGLLGMLPMKQPRERYSLSYLSKPEFLQDINAMIEGSKDTILTIPCTQNEIDQFVFGSTEPLPSRNPKPPPSVSNEQLMGVLQQLAQHQGVTLTDVSAVATGPAREGSSSAQPK